MLVPTSPEHAAAPRWLVLPGLLLVLTPEGPAYELPVIGAMLRPVELRAVRRERGLALDLGEA